MSKPKRKKITKLGWGLKWETGQHDFFTARKDALNVRRCFNYHTAILFRCKIEEVTK